MKTNKENLIQVLFLSSVLILIFIFFFQTLYYPPKAFDEIVIFKENFLPSCNSFSEMFELISLLGLKQYFEATNFLYSNIVSFRCNPLGNLIQLTMQVLFKKNPFNFHLFSLILHIINSTVLFFIILKSSKLFYKDSNNYLTLTTSSILTLLWALHPVNIESVLLLSNAITLLSYSFTFISILIFLNNNSPSPVKSLALFSFYLFGLFIAEFHFFMPVILTTYTFVKLAYFNDESITYTKCLKISLLKSLPIILAMLVFIISFTLSKTGSNLSTQNDTILVLERIFWLAPQTLFHFIKLFFLPISLSVDQSLLVNLGKSILDPYAVCCFLFISIFGFFSAQSILKIKKSFPFFLISFSFFIFSLIPFSQIIAPIYNLASERYLYFPSFIFIFGISHFIFKLFSENKKQKLILLILISITILYSARGYIRTLDWKDSQTLYLSSISSAKNHILIAQRYYGLYPQSSILKESPENDTPSIYKQRSVEELLKSTEIYKSETDRYQNSIPRIIKNYGLDPETLLIKSICLLTQIKFASSDIKDYKMALDSISPYTKDLTRLDSATIAFYASILYFNGLGEDAEKILKKGLELYPFSTRLVFPLCDLILIKYGDINQIESLTLNAFKYYPYDILTLFAMTKLYELKGDLKNYAHYSYIFGLRIKSIEHLKSAYNAYIKLNDIKKAEEVEEKINNAINKKN